MHANVISRRLTARLSKEAVKRINAPWRFDDLDEEVEEDIREDHFDIT
jgi:hypothetical protein